MMFKICVALFALLAFGGGAAIAADKPQSDAAISDTVLIRLSADREINGGALKVDVKDGVATITGVVETQRQKDKVSKVAKKVKGVKQVVNSITLKDRAGK
jgi:osmotically-inducible protein OsmY